MFGLGGNARPGGHQVAGAMPACPGMLCASVKKGRRESQPLAGFFSRPRPPCSRSENRACAQRTRACCYVSSFCRRTCSGAAFRRHMPLKEAPAVWRRDRVQLLALLWNLDPNPCHATALAPKLRLRPVAVQAPCGADDFHPAHCDPSGRKLGNAAVLDAAAIVEKT